jgi:hypothetical protein
MPRGDHWPHWRERLATGHTLSPAGCHVWQRSRNNKGYGVIHLEGKLRLAHRAAWFAHYGVWPTAGLVVDHICENRACVRIEHLRLLTNAENIRRSVPNYGTKESAKCG